MLDFENIHDLTIYSNCFNEALRMQPPVYTSSFVMMMEDVTAGGVHIKKGDAISIDMYRLCNTPS
jgi:cytochrome P450